jgi:hypothetical protein
VSCRRFGGAGRNGALTSQILGLEML